MIMGLVLDRRSRVYHAEFLLGNRRQQEVLEKDRDGLLRTPVTMQPNCKVKFLSKGSIKSAHLRVADGQRNQTLGPAGEGGSSPFIRSSDDQRFANPVVWEKSRGFAICYGFTAIAATAEGIFDIKAQFKRGLTHYLPLLALGDSLCFFLAQPHSELASWSFASVPLTFASRNDAMTWAVSEELSFADAAAMLERQKPKELEIQPQ